MEDIVIVVDNSNYKSSYAEAVPYKCKVIHVYDNEVLVKSISTGKEYDLYHHQVLEFMDIEDITKLIDIKKYGT